MADTDDAEFDLPPELIQLENELRALGEDAMLLEELDGFFAGLLVCPDMVMPGEWLPVVWTGKADAPLPADKDHVNRVFALMMLHYNSIVVALMDHPELYDPLLPFDENEDRYVWELWAAGFGRAMELRPKAWQQLLDADASTAAAMRGLMTLVDDACNVPVLDDPAADARVTEAPDDIPLWVVTLHEWRLANYLPPTGATNAPLYAATPVRTGPKTGRNDPCPCGSGKKYKKCCGLN